MYTHYNDMADDGPRYVTYTGVRYRLIHTRADCITDLDVAILRADDKTQIHVAVIDLLMDNPTAVNHPEVRRLAAYVTFDCRQIMGMPDEYFLMCVDTSTEYMHLCNAKSHYIVDCTIGIYMKCRHTKPRHITAEFLRVTAAAEYCARSFIATRTATMKGIVACHKTEVVDVIL